MTEQMSNDEHVVEKAIRESFPLDAGLSAEKTRELHMQLRPAEQTRGRSRRRGFVVGVSMAATLAVAAASFGVYSALPEPVPEPAVADSVQYKGGPSSSAALGQSTAVPAMALRAINPSDKVLHFSSVAQTDFGPDVGKSTEEMWLDPKTGAGRLVRVNGTGEKAVTTIVVSDGSLASVTTKVPGRPDVTEPAEMSGRLAKSFDKLSAYRQMLESGAATVTAKQERDGVETYKLRAEVDGFGSAEFRIVIEAEIRADDYLPISCKSGLMAPSGETKYLKTRDFSAFETVEVGDLPADWFKPSTKATPGGGVSGVLDI